MTANEENEHYVFRAKLNSRSHSLQWSAVCIDLVNKPHNWGEAAAQTGLKLLGVWMEPHNVAPLGKSWTYAVQFIRQKKSLQTQQNKEEILSAWSHLIQSSRPAAGRVSRRSP